MSSPEADDLKNNERIPKETQIIKTAFVHGFDNSYMLIKKSKKH